MKCLPLLVALLLATPLGQLSHGQTNSPATNTPASSPAAPDLTKEVQIDVDKVMPALALPAPWVAATPQQLKSMQLYINSLLKGGMGFAGFTDGSRGFLHDKNAKVDVLTGELIGLSISQHGLTPQLFLFGYQREKQESIDSVNSNLNGIISNFTWEKPSWNAKLGTVICPCSWQNFDGSTSRIRLYFIPAKTYTIDIVVLGGTSKPDQIFTDTELAISKITLPADVALTPAWGEQLTTLLSAQ